ncbi:MAG: response regulator, partial [Bacteroidetes bacterium]
MPRKILIVEDEPVSAKVLQRMLMDAGYQDVVIASEAREALKLLLMDQFDLLLVDWVLPGYSGPELIRRIRAA